MTSHDHASAAAGPAGNDARDPLCRAFVDATAALVCVVDGDGRILLANQALQRFTGRGATDLVGRYFWDVWVVPEHVALARDAVARAMATGRAYPQEGDWLTADGTRRTIMLQNDVLFDGQGRAYAVAAVGLDVTEQRQREALLHRRAHTDLLTGLLNRSALFEALNQHLDPEVGRGCAVLFCDLDQFKVVNDRHGHAVGDRLLADVAARLRAVAGPGDVVARFGGDEFVFVCAHGDEGRLAALANRVRTQVRAPFAGPSGPLTIGVSIGIATGQRGEAVDDLIARADRAMYGAKTHQVRRHPRPRPPVDDVR